MDIRTAVERLQFTPDGPEGVATHAFYDGLYLASIIASAHPWTADCRGIDLGRFPTRVAARAAVAAWVGGLDMDEWPVPRDTCDQLPSAFAPASTHSRRGSV
ncbi:MAG: hypothetical protein P4L92_22405 [Rudaea sp.]|nr:hypothetical protein [Rudaea sp.]